MKKQDRGPAAPAAHTPGPWLVDADGEVFPVGPDGEPVIEREIAMVVSDNAADRPLITAAPALADAVADLLSVMEMQEKRESGEFHITGEVAFGIWSDAKARATTALRAAGRLATAGSASASEPPALECRVCQGEHAPGDCAQADLDQQLRPPAAPAASEKEGAP